MDKQRYDIMIGMQAGELTAGVKTAKKDLGQIKQAFKDTLDVLNTNPAKFGFTDTKQIIAARKEIEKNIKALEKLLALGKTTLAGGVGPKGSQASIRQSAEVKAGVSSSASLIQQAAPSAIAKAELVAQNKEIAARNKLAVAEANAKKQLQSRSITLRYALYDVASAAQSASQALLGYASAAINAAAAQEQAFSRVQKTLGDIGTEELLALKDELLALTTQIPVSFDEISKIAMLGSQMGIEAEGIAQFTEVVAKFSAITEMSVEETAMAFGKIGGILGISSDQYEALGSSIAAVGFDSKATETQIVSTAGQIGAVARAAGLSSSEIIGLSAAFASLKIAPEESRGVIVRTFNEISKAAGSFSEVSGLGSERLKRFAEIAGMSSADFAKGWGDKSPEGASVVWQKFVRGLSTRNISTELRQLGLDGVRTSKGLTALASDVELIFGKEGEVDGGLIGLAKKSGAGGLGDSFLDKSFAVIVDDLVSKMKMLQNSFENLFAAVASGPLFEIFKGAIDLATRFNEVLTNAIKGNGLVSAIAQLSVLIAGLGGVLLAVAATAALSGASFQAMKTAHAAATAMSMNLGKGLIWLKTQLTTTTIAARTAGSGFVGMGAGAGAASAGILTAANALRVFKLALVTTGIGAVLVVIGELVAGFMETNSEASQTRRGLDELGEGFEKARIEAAKAKSELMEFIKMGLEPIADSVKAQDSLFKLGESLRENGQDWSEYTEGGRANITALQSTIESYVTAFGGDAQLLANNLLALREYMIQMGMGGAAAFAMLDLAIGETGVVAQKAVFDFSSLNAAFGKITTGAGKAKTALELMTEALEKALKALDATADIESTLDDFGASISENGKKFDLFSESGRNNFKSLRDVIFGLNKMVDGDPQSLANALASLREAMIRLGITSATAFQTVDLAIQATGRSGVATAEIINGLVATISQAAEEAKGLRTVTDYASDLSSVLSDALENRYGRQDARDSITSAWNSIAEAASNARQSVEEANASLNAMRATKGVLEYQLSVALRYGDTLRAEAIRARLAEVNSEIISGQEDAAKAADEASMTLVGNSSAAMENRQEVRDLASSYNEYLASLAATGMSSRQLAEQAAVLEQEFLNQGVALGFSREELAEYTQAFKQDFTTVINNLPRDITLNVNTDPALQAIIDFVKDANEELARLLSGTPGGSPTFTGGTTTTGGGTTTTGGGTTTTARQNLEAQIKQLQDNIAQIDRDLAPLRERVAYLRTRVQTPAVRQELAEKNATINDLNQTKVRNANRIDSLRAQLAQLPAAAKGGLVKGSGNGTSDSITARLSNGEYVLRANAVKYYGTDFMNSLNQMQVQTGSSGGQGGGVVYLSPEDRALLRSAIDRPISLYTENTKIASSANAGNVVLAQRGAR
jgi:hypothetical protein